MEIHRQPESNYFCPIRRPSDFQLRYKDESTGAMLKRSQAYLSQEQVERLLDVMNEEIDIHGRGNFPTLHLTLSSLIKRVQFRLTEHRMKINQIKMNGGAASYILASRDLPYTDIDLIFGGVDLSESKNFEIVKDAVLEALIDFLPQSTNKSKITLLTMKEAYVKKMVKVCDEDMWSLISLNNDLGRFIELKFVHKMRRQFEFSVDSFQIHLDSILHDRQHVSSPIPIRCDPVNHATEDGGEDRDGSDCGSGNSETAGIDENPKVPLVLAESVYGDFRSALKHLNKMLIDTTEPELIRGGGLLKYVQLLSRGYRPARAGQCRHLEPYMCSRFFIDFPTVIEQRRKLKNYMDNHFGGNLKAKYEYLLLLFRVVDESTVCLMNNDRKLTLNMINQTAYDLSVRIYYEEQRRYALLTAKNISMKQMYNSSSSGSNSGANSTRSTTPITIQSSNGGQNETESECAYEIKPQQQPMPQPQQFQLQMQQGQHQNQENRSGDERPKPKQTLLYVPPNASYWIKVA